MKVKRSLAMLTVLAMLLSMLTAMPVYAANGGLTDANQKAKLELVFMEYIDGVTGEDVKTARGISNKVEYGTVAANPTSVPKDLDVNSEFLIGVKMSGMDRIAEASQGLYNMTVTFTYDTEYVEVIDSNMATYSQRRLNNSGIFNADTFDPTYGYYTGAMNAAVVNGTVSKYNYTITFPSASEAPNYYGTTDGYLGISGFKVIKKPTNGAKVFDFLSASGANLTLSYGTAGAVKYEANKTTDNADSVALFDFDASGADIFPMPKQPKSAVLAAAAPTLKVNSGSALGTTLTNVKLNVTYTDNSTANNQNPTAFYLLDTDAAPSAKPADSAKITGTTTFDDAKNGKYVYAMFDEGGAQVYVRVGQLTVDKTVKTVVPSSTAVNVTYGETLKSEADKLTFTVTYSDNSTETVNGNSSDLTWKINMNQAPAVGNYTVTATYKGKPSSNIAFTVAKKQITITSIANVTPTKVGGATEVSGTATGDAITATGLVGSDKITVTYKATYSDVSAESSNATVAIKDLVLANSAPSNNYTLSGTTATGTGSVSNVTYVLQSIAVTTNPTKMSYVEGDPLDMTGIVVTATLKEEGGTATKTETVTDGLTYAVDSTAVTSGTTLAAIAMNGKPVTVTYNGKTATTTANLEVTANAITGIEIKGVPAKLEYNVGEELDLTGLKVELTYANGTKTEVAAADFGATVAVTVDGAAITAGTKAAAAMNGKGITVTANGKSATTTETLTINAAVGATPEPAVAAPDHKTNNIVVTLPADAAELEYAIVADEAEAPTTFTKFGKDGSVVFSALADGTALAADTQYDVYVRRAKQGEVLASAAVKTDVKTFKNKITVLNKNGSELSVGYADDGEIATQNALHEIVEEPSRLQGYFTDADLTNDVVFPLTISADTTLYAKQRTSSGGGGGGGGWASTPTPTLSLSHSNVSGHVGETAALKATLKDSTATITWSSDNEAVATVDENGVVTFVSVGTAKITATAGNLKATTEVEVLEEGVEPPVEESLINEKYTGAYVYGYEDGTFGATREITRAEVVAMVSRLLKNPIDENVEYETSFSDVADGAWYKNYIGFLAQYGIVEGYSDGTFAPANKITRAEMTAILARAAKFQLTGSAASFSDVADGFWAKAYIATMADKGYVNGYEDGTFAPNRNITRAETVAILNRMLDDSEAVGSIVPADVDASYWAYNEIVKAMNDRRLK